MTDTLKFQSFPLTHAQKRVWLVEGVYGPTPIHHLMAVSLLLGSVDFRRLQTSIYSFVQRNEGTRLRIVRRLGEVHQYVSEWEHFDIPLLDFTEHEDPEAALEQWVSERSKQFFELEEGRLFAFYFVRMDEHRTGFLFVFHHLISDGWSLTSMINEIWSTYVSLQDTGAAVSPTEETKPSYIDYIDMEQKYLSSPRFSKNKTFWQTQFQTLPEDLAIRTTDQTAGRRYSFLLDTKLSESIKQLAAVNQCSINTVFVLLMLLFLTKSERRNDWIIGTPVLNRSGKKEREMFGMFTSTVPFRYQCDLSLSIIELLTSIQEDLTKTYFHQKYPYDLLVQDLELKKRGLDGLFDVCVNYYNTKMLTELAGQPLETTELYSGEQLYSLQIVIKDWRSDGRLLVSFDYKQSLYTDNRIQLMWNQMRGMLEQMIERPEQTAYEVEIVGGDEKQKLLFDRNRTIAMYPKHKTIHQLIEEQAEREPERIALRQEDGQFLNYRDLNARANQLARYLRSKGVTRDCIVGILATHSIEMVVGLLAVLKAGGAYLPIDPNYPVDRVRYMLTDSAAALLLANVSVDTGLHFNGEIVDLKETSYNVYSDSPLEIVNEPEDLVYVIYTSGSTGKPKGVMIEHRGLTNYIWWAKKHYIAESTEAFALYSSISFDLTVTSIFTPLVNGNPIHIFQEHGDDFVLFRIMDDPHTHIVKLTPAHLSLLKDRDNRKSQIRRFIVGGEDFKSALARSICMSFGRNIEIFNEYGPTETVVGCMIYEFVPEADTGGSVPIGCPADNVQLYVLDENLKLVPDQGIGELYIAGDGVSRGYVNRPELTEEKFVSNPFTPGTRMYRSGDLVTYREDGILHYLGRMDHQVKIRGFRIELSEIESRLMEHSSITDAAVIDRRFDNGDVFLCAYYTSQRRLDDQELRVLLTKSLPDYMVPSFFTQLVDLPLTPNGKVDRRMLPMPVLNDNMDPTDEEEPVYGSETERFVWEVYRNVLQAGRLNRKHTFYQLGGDSIKAIQISAKLQELGLKIRVKDILATPNIAEAAALVSKVPVVEQSTAVQGPAVGNIPPTPIIQWFLDQPFANRHYWNQSVLLRLKQPIHKKDLQDIMTELILCHDSLRMNLHHETGCLFYNEKHLQPRINVTEADLSNDEEDEQQRRIRELGTQIKSGLCLEDGLLVAAGLFQIDKHGGQLLLLTAHHLTVDAVSWRILLEDFADLFEARLKEEKTKSLSKTHSYQAWAERMRMYADCLTQEEIDYWNKLLNESENCAKLSVSVEDSWKSSIAEHSWLTEDETARLIGPANEAYRTEVFELLIAAVAMTVRKLTGNGKVLLELEGHGREDLFEELNISRTVGWFTSMYPCLLQLHGDDSDGAIRQAKERLRERPGKGIGYGLLAHVKRELPSVSGELIRFNYLGNLDHGFSSKWFDYVVTDSGAESALENRMTCPVEVLAAIVGKQLRITTILRGQIRDASGSHFADCIASSLRRLLEHCLTVEGRELTPSDFEAAALSEVDLEWLLD